MAHLWIIACMIGLACSSLSSHREITSTLGRAFSAAILLKHVVIPDWKVTLFEHGLYGGKQITVGSNYHRCISLNTTELCAQGNTSDCISASNSVSAIKFELGSCVHVYRDLHCLSVPILLDLNFTGSCHENMYALGCRRINDVIGSASSCYYGACKFHHWVGEDLHTYVQSIESRSIVNITRYNDKFMFEMSKRVKSGPLLFFGHTVGERYGFEEITYLKELQEKIKNNETPVFSGSVDPYGTLSSVSTHSIKNAVDKIIRDYEKDDHKHRDLRQVVPAAVLPAKTQLIGGNTVYIEYMNIGVVRVQTRLRAILTRSNNNYLPCARTNFRSRSTTLRMTELQAHPFVNGAGDDKGHLIASCIGGTAEVWNLSPQDRDLNRGNGGINWRTVEIAIKDWLVADDCHFVEWDLSITYLGDSPRAFRFTLVVRYYSEENDQIEQDTAELLICNNDPNNVVCTYEAI
jgi:hypothetical protein